MLERDPEKKPINCTDYIGLQFVISQFKVVQYWSTVNGIEFYLQYRHLEAY